MIKVGDLVKPMPGYYPVYNATGQCHGRYGIVVRWVKSAGMWEIAWNDHQDTGYWNEFELRVIK